MFHHATIASLLLGTLAAQTTWTSFEDRKGHAIASDASGGVLMFGGESSSSPGTLLGDTNAFTNLANNPTWTRLLPVDPPSPRTEHAMASGVGTDDTAIFILFGGLAQINGSTNPVPSGETFVYNGGWGTTGIGMTHPSARTGHTMVTDPQRNRVVLFGGRDATGRRNDLWEFDVTSLVWLQPTITGPLPPNRFDHAAAFHPGNNSSDGRILVTGGAPFRDDIWQYDPWTSTWTDVTPPSPATRPPVRRRAAFAYLDGTDQLVLFGGESDTFQPLNDTWIWNRAAGTWAEQVPASRPPMRFDHAMAPDQLGNNLILLGGDDGSGSPLAAGTWLWNGVQWAEQIAPPSARTGVAMAYDSVRNRHVLFGGHDSGGDLDETWELEGLNWRNRLPPTGPAARGDAGLVFDAARNRTVLFGGRANGTCGTPLGDLWEWDGQLWLPRNGFPNTPPAAGGVQPVFDDQRGVVWMLVNDEMWRYDGAGWDRFAWPSRRERTGYTFDEARSRLIIACGRTNTTELDEVWEWDGNRWHERTPPSSPAARQATAICYATNRGDCVLLGGYDATGSALGDTWLWDGAPGIWTNANQPVTPRYWHAAVFDSIANKAYAFGGADQAGTLLNELLRWNGQGWTTLSPPLQPSARIFPGLAFDPINAEIVMFGGSVGNSTDTGDTWTFDGSNWTHHPVTGTAPAGRHSVLAFDGATNKVMLFGGLSYVNGLYDDTWLWDGATDAWTEVIPNSTPGSPPGRRHHALTGTPIGVLLFGGQPQSADLWEWNGSTWTRIGAGQPPLRTNYAACYDQRRDRVIVFGGRSDCAGGNLLDDHWEWDGRGWHEMTPTVRPAARERAQLTYDSSRGRAVLFGGTGAIVFADTWEWDGQTWTQRLPTAIPPAMADHGASFDLARGVSVSFGYGGTWDYGPIDPAAITPFGSGCLGSAGIPMLKPRAWAGPWLGDRAEIDIVNAPPGLGLFVWGFSNTAWIGGALPFSLAPLGSGPGCNLLVSDTIVQVFVSNSNPYPYVSFVLPSDPSFLGAVMYTQAGFLDAGLAGAPVVSHGLELTFGSK
ncbi:MAG: hypothetical protein KDE27_26865 [Planctomycetes bacterium]|nr:hypothetical protein [Planctomycetota bacterium]